MEEKNVKLKLRRERFSNKKKQVNTIKKNLLDVVLEEKQEIRKNIQE